MQKPEQKNFLLEVAEQQGDIIYKDNKTMAKLNWVIPWNKNPKLSEEKDLKRLENQIEELGVYKPLLVYLEKNNAVILGGNQRYKVLKKLREKYAKNKENKYEYVWVSVVNADNDYDKVKYALSDNEQIGKYDVDKLKEVLEPQIKQGNLFSEYTFNFDKGQSIDTLAQDLSVSREEMEFKQVKKVLQNQGINDETLKALETMTNFNKIREKLDDVNIKGEVTGQKFPLLFWIDDEELYKQLQEIYSTRHKDKYNTELLVEQVQTITGATLPTTIERLKEIKETLKKTTMDMHDAKELGGRESKLYKDTKTKIDNWKEEIIHIANLYFPGLIVPQVNTNEDPESML